ncbi:MAG: EAL and HDOD domain-containing protein [Solirubrobacteraceae bacterium]
MSATPAEEQAPWEEGRLLVTRQPVVDARTRVKGYRIIYGMLEGKVPCMPSGADALRLFNEVFSVMSLETLIGGSVAYVPIARELLLMVGIPSILRDRVVLRVKYEDAISAEFAPSLDRGFRRGAALELDRVPGPEFDFRLLDQFGVVEIDLSRWSEVQIAEVMPEIVSRRGVALATNVRDHRQRDEARELGFEWFSGPYLTRGVVVEGRKVPSRALTALVDVARLQSETITLDQLIRVIECDRELSERLLQHINSAHFGFATKVRTVRHATVLLGSREVARWAMLHATLACAPRTAPAQMAIALTRAGMCERLAAVRPGVAPDELFTAGMLSMAHVLAGVSLDSIVRGLTLSGLVEEALLDRTGPVGEILDAVIAYERGDFDSPCLSPIIQHCGVAYRQALSWAQGAMASLK